ASSAKRLPGPVALPMLQTLLKQEEEPDELHIPLLLWWALESKAETDRDAVVGMFRDKVLWESPLVREVILERLMQRHAMAGGKENLLACARLLERAPDREGMNRLLVGLEKGFAGRSARGLPAELRRAVSRAWSAGATAAKLTLGLRLGEADAV